MVVHDVTSSHASASWTGVDSTSSAANRSHSKGCHSSAKAALRGPWRSHHLVGKLLGGEHSPLQLQTCHSISLPGASAHLHHLALQISPADGAVRAGLSGIVNCESDSFNFCIKCPSQQVLGQM